MDATPSPDPELDCLNAAYGTLGYTVTRNGDGSLRAVHPGPPKHASEADTAAGLRRSIIEREKGSGVNGFASTLTGTG